MALRPPVPEGGLLGFHDSGAGARPAVHRRRLSCPQRLSESAVLAGDHGGRRVRLGDVSGAADGGSRQVDVGQAQAARGEVRLQRGRGVPAGGLLRGAEFSMAYHAVLGVTGIPGAGR